MVDDAEYEISARFHLATALHHQGRGDEADEAIAPAVEIAAALRYTGSDVPLAWLRWLRAVETDDPEADAIGREALARHRRTTIVGLPSSPGCWRSASAPVGTPAPADVVRRPPATRSGPSGPWWPTPRRSAGDLPTALRLLGERPRPRRRLRRLFGRLPRRRGARGSAGDDRLGRRRRADPAVRARVATYGSVLVVRQRRAVRRVGLAGPRAERRRGRLAPRQAVDGQRATCRGRCAGTREARDRLAVGLTAGPGKSAARRSQGGGPMVGARSDRPPPEPKEHTMTTTFDTATHSPAAHESLGCPARHASPAGWSTPPTRTTTRARTPWVVNVDQRRPPSSRSPTSATSSRPSGGRAAHGVPVAVQPGRPRPADHPRRHPAAAHPRPAGHRRRPGPAAPSPSAPASTGASCAPPSTAPG